MTAPETIRGYQVLLRDPCGYCWYGANQPQKLPDGWRYTYGGWTVTIYLRDGVAYCPSCGAMLGVTAAGDPWAQDTEGVWPAVDYLHGRIRYLEAQVHRLRKQLARARTYKSTRRRIAEAASAMAEALTGRRLP
jgi:hypothetical protein